MLRLVVANVILADIHPIYMDYYRITTNYGDTYILANAPLNKGFVKKVTLSLSHEL